MQRDLPDASDGAATLPDASALPSPLHSPPPTNQSACRKPATFLAALKNMTTHSEADLSPTASLWGHQLLK